MYIVTKSCLMKNEDEELRLKDEKYFFDDEKDVVNQYVQEKTPWLWGKDCTEQRVTVDEAINPCGRILTGYDENKNPIFEKIKRKPYRDKSIVIKDGHRKWVDVDCSDNGT